MARQANEGTATAEEEVVELAAVKAAIAAHVQALPQNIFAPFAIHHPQAELTHWGNVDTGSMVNIVYEGVVHAFPYLKSYWEDTKMTVEGVGGKYTQVVGKLVDVPISLGLRCMEEPCTYATFYVLKHPGYHYILGLTFLKSIDGVVSCRS